MTKKIITLEEDHMIALKVIKQTEGKVHTFQITELLKAHAKQVQKDYPKQWKEVEDATSN